MTEVEARLLIESMTAYDSEPTLTDTQVALLVERARRPDSDGLLPSDDGWTGTYDLNAAAAEGWRWKAGKVAGSFTFASDGQTFNRADMVKACQEMARTFRDRVVGSIPILPPTEWDTDIVGNVNA